MALVGVIAKELTEKDLEMASRGLTPPDLGGGPFGAKGVPRGFPNPTGSHEGGQGRTRASDKFRERMKGGADVPAHAMNRENTGQSIIAHPASLEEVRQQGLGGDDEARDAANERMHRLIAQAKQGGRGLAGAMRRQGINPREWYEGGPGVPAGFKHGVRTADIPGTTEVAPHVRHHTELPEGKGDVDDVLDELAQSHDRRVTGQDRQQLSAGANTPNTEQRNRADQPEGTGSRRTED
mgnify:FL=1